MKSWKITAAVPAPRATSVDYNAVRKRDRTDGLRGPLPPHCDCTRVDSAAAVLTEERKQDSGAARAEAEAAVGSVERGEQDEPDQDPAVPERDEAERTTRAVGGAILHGACCAVLDVRCMFCMFCVACRALRVG
jgi:hypothetical protein